MTITKVYEEIMVFRNIEKEVRTSPPRGSFLFNEISSF